MRPAPRAGEATRVGLLEHDEMACGDRNACCDKGRMDSNHRGSEVLPPHFGHGDHVRRQLRRHTRMGAMDKLRDKAQAAKGESKEKLGDATDNEQWQAEGKADKAKGNLKQAGEKGKDAFYLSRSTERSAAPVSRPAAPTAGGGGRRRRPRTRQARRRAARSPAG